MNKALLCLLAAALPLFAQAVRFDPTPVMKTAGNVGPGGYPQLLAVPGPQVAVCAAPANGIPCTNYATTYSDSTAVTACPTNAQITIAASNTCVAFGDARGNFGFWIKPGSYDYTVTFAGVSYGPYPITIQDTSNIPPAIATFGCLGNGVHNDQPCFNSMFAANASAVVPAGNYLIDLSAFSAGWTPSNYSGTLTFLPGAKWIIIPPTNHAVSSMIVFNIFNGAEIDGLHITYQTPQITPCLSVSDYCTNTLAVINSGTSGGVKGPTFKDLWIDNAQAIALIVSNNYNVTFNDTVIGPSAGTIFNGNENLHINGFSCPATTWDDCLNVTSQSAAVAGTVGAFINGLYSFNSWASGLRIGTPEVSVSGFDIISAQNDGIDIQYASVFSQTDPPARVSLSNGTIRIVRNNGQATSPSAPKCGIYISSDLSGNNIGNISIVNTDIDAPDGAGVCSSVSSALIGTLSIANSHVNSAGNGTDPALEGSCFHIIGFKGFSAVGNECNAAKGLGYYVDGLGVGTATIAGGRIFDANTLQGSGAAIWMHNLDAYDVGGVNIIDDRNPSDSFVLKADSTIQPSLFHDINFNVLFPSTTHFVTLTGSTSDVFRSISPGVRLNFITAPIANGSGFYCPNCDTPASQGVTCTNVGDNAGAQLNVTRGVNKCY